MQSNFAILLQRPLHKSKLNKNLFFTPGGWALNLLTYYAFLSRLKRVIWHWMWSSCFRRLCFTVPGSPAILLPCDIWQWGLRLLNAKLVRMVVIGGFLANRGCLFLFQRPFDCTDHLWASCKWEIFNRYVVAFPGIYCWSCLVVTAVGVTILFGFY